MLPPLPPVLDETLHRLWRLLPTGGRRALLSQATALIAPIADRNPAKPAHGLAIAGEFSRSSQSGDAARLMAAAAASLGVACWRLDIPPILGRMADREAPRDAPPPAGAPLVVHMNPPLLPLALLRLPHQLSRGRRVIGYWSHEMPVVPRDWRIGARFVHEVWTASRYAAAAMEPLLPGRVRVVPPAVAEDPPEPSSLDRAAFGLPDDAVVVLASVDFADSFTRENPLGTIAAFQTAFGDRPDRILVLRIAHYDQAPGDFGQLRLAARAANIRLETRPMPAGDHHALTLCADIVLALHHATGFGMEMAWAMLLGKPVIATKWSGNLDYMDNDNAVLIGSTLTEAPDRRGNMRGIAWAEPDISEAVAQLRRLADDAQARRMLGERAKASARMTLTSAPLADALRELGVLDL